MAYILIVNPSILSQSGMDISAVFTATALASCIGTVIMAFIANYPFGMAPGMGLNALFTFTICLGMKFSWQTALAASFIEGIIFLALNLFTPPCFAAIGAMRSEMGDRKWLFRGLSFQLSVGYIVALLISQLGSLIVYGEVASGWLPAIIVILGYVVLITYLVNRAD